MKTTVLMWCAVLALWVGGCQSEADDAGGATTPDAQVTDTSADLHGLANAPTWILVGMTKDGVAQKLPAKYRALVSFNADHVSGNAGCNHFSGPYTA